MDIRGICSEIDFSRARIERTRTQRINPSYVVPVKTLSNISYGKVQRVSSLGRAQAFKKHTKRIRAELRKIEEDERKAGKKDRPSNLLRKGKKKCS